MNFRARCTVSATCLEFDDVLWNKQGLHAQKGEEVVFKFPYWGNVTCKWIVWICAGIKKSGNQFCEICGLESTHCRQIEAEKACLLQALLFSIAGHGELKLGEAHQKHEPTLYICTNSRVHSKDALRLTPQAVFRCCVWTHFCRSHFFWKSLLKSPSHNPETSFTIFFQIGASCYMRSKCTTAHF